MEKKSKMGRKTEHPRDYLKPMELILPLLLVATMCLFNQEQQTQLGHRDSLTHLTLAFVICTNLIPAYMKANQLTFLLQTELCLR